MGGKDEVAEADDAALWTGLKFFLLVLGVAMGSDFGGGGRGSVVTSYTELTTVTDDSQIVNGSGLGVHTAGDGDVVTESLPS